jgi:eukaryotic-like serine/threonine-protein kinase
MAQLESAERVGRPRARGWWRRVRGPGQRTMAVPESGFWKQVEEAFEAALAAGEDARTRVLEAHCAGRADLRAEVESLLAAHAGAGGFLSAPVVEGPDTVPQIPGARVGAFRVLERVASGGMGEVFRAERVEGDFTQQVAIKLIAARLTGAETVRRFRAERQILATLQHPNIVSLLDGGVTPSGQPYIAMEFVAGEPITEFCRREAAPLETRLRLFRQLCAAVGFAHRRLIVHRDLKPANVLVNREGTVKVLDFGVAKLLDADAPPAVATLPLLLPLTPNYASPEQMRGLPVTTACDLYALGVLLYELLTGRRPYETAGRTLDEVLALVLDREPSRPSGAPGRAVPYDLRRLRGDLDAIVLKAMAKTPDARYGSAEELADDIDRFLSGQPVVAREPSLGYLARKTVARHRAAFAVSAIALVLLVAALVGALWQAQVATREHARAVERFDDVRELAGALIFRIHDEVAPLAGSTPVRQTVIAEGLKFLERLERDATGDPGLQLELAEAYVRIGDVQGRRGAANLGDVDAARASYRRALRLAAAAAEADRTPEALAAVVKANLALSGVLDRPESRLPAEAALAVASEWHRREPESVRAIELVARARFFVAIAAGYPDGLSHWQDADRLYHLLLAREPDRPDRIRNAALTQKYLGAHFEQAGQWEKALQHHERAYALDERRVQADPADRSAQLDLAIDMSNIGYGFWKRREHDRAIEWYRHSLESRERLAADDPEDVYTRGRVAYVHERLARLYLETGRSRLARTHVREAIALGQPLAESDPLLYLAQLAEAQHTAGDIELREGRRTVACAAYAAAVRSFASAHEPHLAVQQIEARAEAERQARVCGAP